MSENDKKIIINHVISAIMLTIWAMLIAMGILILVSEGQNAVAILAGIGLISNVIMIINEVQGIKTWLNVVDNINTVVINK